jgi:tetratricopeptide (TPR) repeat protein
VQVLNNLGVLFSEQGRYREAEPFLRQALEARLQRDETVPRALVHSLETYASVLRNLDRAAEAEAYEARAQALRSQSN